MSRSISRRLEVPIPPARKEIGGRLRQFAVRIGGPSALARAIGVSPQQVSDYLNGRWIPGNKMQARLQALGCDTTWLMTGKSQTELDKDLTKLVRGRILGANFTEADGILVTVLHSCGIESVEDFFSVVDYQRLLIHMKLKGMTPEDAMKLIVDFREVLEKTERKSRKRKAAGR